MHEILYPMCGIRSPTTASCCAPLAVDAAILLTKHWNTALDVVPAIRLGRSEGKEGESSYLSLAVCQPMFRIHELEIASFDPSFLLVLVEKRRSN